MQKDTIWTPLKLVQQIKKYFELKGLDGSHRLEAELIVGHVLGLSRLDIYLEIDKPCVEAELDEIRRLMRKRINGIPIAYILGHADFSFLNISVNSQVLIPRSDTECLIEIMQQFIPRKERIRILEIGTGSGNLPLALVTSMENLEMIATDISQEALDTAKQNYEALQEKIQFNSSVEFKHSDKFSKIPTKPPFDFILSNPPYLSDKDMETYQEKLRYEPRLALHGGADGLDFYRHFRKQGKDYLKAGGYLVFEHGANQQEEIQKIYVKSPEWELIQKHKDLNGMPRALVYRAKGR